MLTEEMIGLTGEIEECGDPWPFELRRKCGHPSFSSERAALESLFGDLDVLVNARADFLKSPVVFPEAGLKDQKTIEAVAHAVESGKPFGFLSFGTSEAKEHVAAIRIQGRAPSSTEDWLRVQQWIALQEKVLTFETRWNELHQLLSVPALEGSVAGLRQLELTATVARKAHRLSTHFDDQLSKGVRKVFEQNGVVPANSGREDLERLRDQLLEHLTFADLSLAAMQLSDIQGKLAGKTGPISERLRNFISDTLGKESVPRERAAASYAELLEELRRIAALATPLSFVTDMSSRLELAGAPQLNGYAGCALKLLYDRDLFVVIR
jgi:hypothetical protein